MDEETDEPTNELTETVIKAITNMHTKCREGSELSTLSE